MPVIRVDKTKDYTVMANYHLKDKRLSLKAIGLLSKILSLPSDWDYTVEGLASICKDKRDCIRKAIIELEENGYITRSRQRLSNGTLGDMEYIVREKPELSDQQVKKPALENPTLVNPTLEKPTLENPPQLNTNTSSTKKESTQESNSIAADAAAPSPSGKEENEAARRIIGYLNEKTGKHFKGGERTVKLIRARMKEGFTEDDFRTVIDNKTAEWSHDARMAEYLRPETLFGTKFESYLNAAPVGKSASYGAGLESDGESSFDVNSMFNAALRRSYEDMGINAKTNQGEKA